MTATPPVITSLADISAGYDVLYCDLWGCLHNGIRPFPGAVEALASFKAQGGTVILLTNAPRPWTGVAAQLDGMGVPRGAWDAIVTSGDASRAEVAAGAVGRRVEHVGPDRDLPFFDDLDVERVSREEAEGVVLTGLFDDETESPDDYAEAIAAWLARDLPVLCANPDVIVDRGEARVYCAGAIAQAFNEAGGAALYAGKPHAPIYRLAAETAQRVRGAGPWRTLAVGDGMGTDILGGQQAGLRTLLVTAGLAASQVLDSAGRLDPARLGAWLAPQPVQPNYAMGGFR